LESPKEDPLEKIQEEPLAASGDTEEAEEPDEPQDEVQEAVPEVAPAEVQESLPEEDEKETVSVEEVEDLIESLIEADVTNQYGVQDIAAEVLSLKEKLESADDNQRHEAEKYLAELYETAKAIKARLQE
jgi:uncharacterized protein YggL (DUF469 family)